MLLLLLWFEIDTLAVTGSQIEWLVAVVDNVLDVVVDDVDDDVVDTVTDSDTAGGTGRDLSWICPEMILLFSHFNCIPSTWSCSVLYFISFTCCLRSDSRVAQVILENLCTTLYISL